MPAMGRWSSPFTRTSFSAGACAGEVKRWACRPQIPMVPDVWAGEADIFDIWGVVTHVVKQVSG